MTEDFIGIYNEKLEEREERNRRIEAELEAEIEAETDIFPNEVIAKIMAITT